MKKHLSLTFGAILAFSSVAGAQGLLSIGHNSNDDFDSQLPFTTTIGVDVGWDSNPGNSSSNEQDSAFIRGGITAAYANGSRTSNFSLNAGFSTIYYFDDIAGQDENTFYSARVGLNYFSRASRRFTWGNNTYFTYEIEPDNVVGASAARRLSQYLYGYNSLWGSYAWNRRFSTVSRYTLSGIEYDEKADGFGEDRLTHTFSQELRYVLNRLTTLVGDVRYSITDYDSGPRDNDTLYLLAGVDHTFSSDLTGTVRIGAEQRKYDNFSIDDEWRPYAEGSLRYQVAKHSNLVWFNRVGYEDSELGGSPSETRYSFRSALTYNQQFSDRLRGNAGLSYVHSEFEGGLSSDIKEDLFSLNLGVGYRLFSNVDLNANYRFSILDSDESLREYDRHSVSAGLGITW